MKYLLDTDICIYIIRKRSEKVLEKLYRTNPEDVAISSITLSELEYGIQKSSDPEKNRVNLIEFMAPVDVLHYDDMAAVEYGRIRSFLERRGTPIGAMDLLIAAHAAALGRTLVTNNVNEFKRVPGLNVQNWA
jgi:tRNA(fMet)-specific endonuclease VapC